MTDVWVTFKLDVPMDVFMSKETAEKNRFRSETVEHYIHVGTSADNTTDRQEQLERANALLTQQIADLTALLEKAEKRMALLEKLLNVPVLMRHKRTA